MQLILDLDIGYKINTNELKDKVWAQKQKVQIFGDLQHIKNKRIHCQCLKRVSDLIEHPIIPWCVAITDRIPENCLLNENQIVLTLQNRMLNSSPVSKHYIHPAEMNMVSQVRDV